ncbi:MAG: carboxypeptidase regulatory-like domain-containing protein [Bacteroidetes bacterium]|nr:carboxypeptidase regulatory-like domain-containing protein [Bacteroidota bacterium]
MKRSKPIQISIPNPCHEDWNKMTPAEQGRFCNSCQKVVTDFTSFTDAQLHSFFSDRSKQVCGRFYNHQLNIPISVPPQPHSRLYRYFIGFGLTLLFTQLPETRLRAQTPHAHIDPQLDKKNKNENDTSIIIKGKVIDELKEPMLGAIVSAYCNGTMVAGTVTDYDGNYKLYIYSSSPKKYDLVLNHTGYKPKSVHDLSLSPGTTIVIDARMEADTVINKNVITTTGLPIIIMPVEPKSSVIMRDSQDQPPLVDPFEPNKTIIDSKEIDHRAH